MKCVKCGYISFDYLSECKKCRTSLTAARESIGFPGVKPAVPFLLGSLLESGPEPESGIAEVETLTSFRLVEEAGAPFDPGDDGVAVSPGEEAVEDVAQQSLPIADPEGLEEDFSLLDLSDEEIELLIDKEALESVDTEAMLTDSITDTGGIRSTEHLWVSELDPPARVLSPPEVEAAAETTPAKSARSLEDYHHLQSKSS
ncbi:MAG TPA: hypothetical protein VEF34_04590 [Syntrophobacteraceae bacterium]|nr:hypothetical protein [Syntrophobacteraceae bacterium]